MYESSSAARPLKRIWLSCLVVACACIVCVARASAPVPPSCESYDPRTVAGASTWRASASAMTRLMPGVQPDRTPAIAIGQRLTVTFRPVTELRYPVRKRVPPGVAPTVGGRLSLRVPRDGVYRFLFSTRAWIDVIPVDADEGALAPLASGPGPQCDGLRKIVDFSMQAGRTYHLDLADHESTVADLLVVSIEPVPRAGHSDREHF